MRPSWHCIYSISWSSVPCILRGVEKGSGLITPEYKLIRDGVTCCHAPRVGRRDFLHGLGHVVGVAEALEHRVHEAGVAQVDQPDHATVTVL